MKHMLRLLPLLLIAGLLGLADEPAASTRFEYSVDWVSTRIEVNARNETVATGWVPGVHVTAWSDKEEASALLVIVWYRLPGDTAIRERMAYFNKTDRTSGGAAIAIHEANSLASIKVEHMTAVAIRQVHAIGQKEPQPWVRYPAPE